jgi:aminomethyltransferase
MVPFAGFEMPVQYGSIVEEHRAVRASAGLFDVSHMGEIRLRGSGALELAQRLFTNDMTGSEAGRVRYGMLCLEDGGVVDDVTLYRLDDDELFFCVNAANIGEDLAWMREVHKSSGLRCEVIDESSDTALLAIQGPDALQIVGGLLPHGLRGPGRWRFVEVELAGIPVLLSRTGYTGEDGYEIYLAAERALALWDALREAGSDRLGLAGLGARDTLRTEMAYPLYGHELDRGRNPIEAGLARFVAFGRGFVGEPALHQVQEAGPRDCLVGLVLEGRQVARSGYSILGEDRVGTVTSGTFGPSIERSIAMGYVAARYAVIGTRLDVEVRGRSIPCQVTQTPFYSKKVRKVNGRKDL